MTLARLLAVIAATAFAVLVLYRVRHGRWGRAGAGAAIATLLALYGTGVLTGVPDPRSAIEESGEALGAWAYLAVGAMAFFETSAPPVTVVFPGEWGVAYGGLLAREGTISLVPLIAVVWAASLLGDSWAFFLGRRLGRSYLVARGAKVGVTHERLAALDAFFARWGPATVAVGRLVPVVRPFVALTAGASDWPFRRFLPWNVLGTGAFAIGFCLLGYAAYATAERVIEAGSDPLVLGAAGLVIVGLVALLRARARSGAKSVRTATRRTRGW